MNPTRNSGKLRVNIVGNFLHRTTAHQIPLLTLDQLPLLNLDSSRGGHVIIQATTHCLPIHYYYTLSQVVKCGLFVVSDCLYKRAVTPKAGSLLVIHRQHI